jgi:NCS1 nucleoside transporter family
MTTISTDEELLDAPEVREGEYGRRITTVEPGGSEFIPISERHGRPLQLLWTWTSPNLEFATVFVGVLAVAAFGLSFRDAVASIVLGTVLGSVSHGVLSARGPAYGVPQMVLSRISFGYWGNLFPAGLNSITAGVGWFAVNSVSGALALNTLTSIPKVGCLILIVLLQLFVAFFGHNLVHAFERLMFPLLTIAFGLAAIWTFSKAHYGGTAHPIPGAFLLSTGATFGYAAGWNPYASDYTRYFKPDTSRLATGWWAGFGVAASCIVLETMGAASATITGANGLDDPTGSFTHVFPTAVRDLTLLAIALGAVSANVLNIYSGALSFTTLGIRLPLHLARAVVALVFGVAGFVVAWNGLHNVSRYENFLLIIAYWIGPWIAVYFTNQFLERRHRVGPALFDRGHSNWAGPLAMAIGMAVSIPLFSNQTKYVGWVPKHHPEFGDITFEVGFVVAALSYVVLRQILPGRRRVIDLDEPAPTASA